MAGGRTIDEQPESGETLESSPVSADPFQSLPSIGSDPIPLPLAVPMCRRIRPDCLFGSHEERQCVDCAFLEEKQFGATLEAEFLKHCRIIQEFVEQTAGELFSAHVASIQLSSSARVLDCDHRSQPFLSSGGLLSVLHNTLQCSDQSQCAKLHEAIKETAKSGRATTILLSPIDRPLQRYSLVFVSLGKRMQGPGSTTQDFSDNVLCLVAPLDRRRFATVRQLMDMFGLSAAEARLARGLCHGDSLEEYAAEQGLKLPTVKTQLRAVFGKTGTDRQASLLRLLSGVPVVRED